MVFIYAEKSDTTVEGVPRMMSPENSTWSKEELNKKDKWSEVCPGVYRAVIFISLFIDEEEFLWRGSVKVRD